MNQNIPNTDSKKKKYMELALELAQRGFSSVEPNPMVGCVIVKNGEIIGQGWHKEFGQAHAEINALADCKSKGHNPKGATVCVTLEPCCHFGKTPPCTKALIEAGVEKVIVAMLDPSKKVAGKGVKQLEEAGISVSVGTCQKEAMLLNPAFIKQALSKEPWVILKWAQSIDGKLSANGLGEEHRWISNESSRKDVHKIRRSVQGILVGIDTILADDPLLSPRPARGRTLTRIVLDSQLRIPLESRILNSMDQGDVIIVTTQSGADNCEKVKQINEKKAKVIAVSQDDNGKCSLNSVLEELGKLDIQRLLVEGGVKIISSFMNEQLADEAIIYIAPKILAGKGSAGIYEELDKINCYPELHYTKTQVFDGDVKISGLFRRISQIGR